MKAMNKVKISAIHPIGILLEEFLLPMGISQYRLANDISVLARRISEIVHGKRSITADTALPLGRYFGTAGLFWINLQAHCDPVFERDRLCDRLDREVKGYAAANA
jgi:addiction module HigA family antidote